MFRVDGDATPAIVSVIGLALFAAAAEKTGPVDRTIRWYIVSYIHSRTVRRGTRGTGTVKWNVLSVSRADVSDSLSERP